MAEISNLTSIGIRETSIGGRLPSELGMLTKLLEIDLVDNSFSGTIPNEWGNLPNIRKCNRCQPITRHSITNPRNFFIYWLRNVNNTLSQHSNASMKTVFITVYSSYQTLTGTFPSGLCNRKQLQLYIPCSMTTTCPATCFDDVGV